MQFFYSRMRLASKILSFDPLLKMCFSFLHCFLGNIGYLNPRTQIFYSSLKKQKDDWRYEGETSYIFCLNNEKCSNDKLKTIIFLFQVEHRTEVYPNPTPLPVGKNYTFFHNLWRNLLFFATVCCNSTLNAVTDFIAKPQSH